MDRPLLFASTLCYLAALMRTIMASREGVFRPGRFNFFAILAGFALQSVFLSVRGHALHRCPLTNLFEVFIFLSWSVALIYMLVGPAYRLSLMGAFTAPVVFLIQAGALVAPIDVPHVQRMPANSWLEFHASISMIACGAFALAGVAGLMYLAQERQLKRRQMQPLLTHLAPLSDLFAAITRLLWLGFGLYSAGLTSGFFTGQPLPVLKMICAGIVWILYGSILAARHFGRLAPKRLASLCVLAFAAVVSVLWAISFTSAPAPLQ